MNSSREDETPAAVAVLVARARGLVGHVPVAEGRSEHVPKKEASPED